MPGTGPAALSGCHYLQRALTLEARPGGEETVPMILSQMPQRGETE